MKRRTFFVVLGLVYLTMLCGCKKKVDQPTPSEVIPELTYATKGVEGFCADREGKFYAYESEEGAICIYDTDGMQTAKIPLEEGDYSNMCVGNGKIYVTRGIQGRYQGMSVVEVSIADGSQKLIYENSKASKPFLMELCQGKLFLLEYNMVDLAATYEMNDELAGYANYGEKLLSIDLETRAVTEVPVPYIKLMCQKDADSLMVYAFEPEVGEFYFAEMDAATCTLSERYYHALMQCGTLYAFAYDDDLAKVIYKDELKGALFAINPANVKEQISYYSTDAYPKNSYDLKCVNGYTYFASDNKVTRLWNEHYVHSVEPLVLYRDSLSQMLPEGTGYAFDVKQVSTETIANALMAGDSDYDFILLSSGSPLAEQIRRIGAYAPLGDVEAVQAYLNESFDYVKDAATAKNGETWMFPFELSCNLLVYNPDVCKEYGIDLVGDRSETALLEAMKTAVGLYTSDGVYHQINLYQEQQRIMEQYLAEYAVKDGKANFDTSLFRSCAELFRKSFAEAGGWSRCWFSSTAQHGATREEIEASSRLLHSKILFGSIENRSMNRGEATMRGWQTDVSYAIGITNYEFLRVLPLPSVDANDPKRNVASADFLVLNPKSQNLENAKAYLNALATALREEETLVRSKALKGSYNALELEAHKIYENSQVVFELPEDVFWQEYLKYKDGNKALDEVILELERKLNTYLKE